MVHSIIFCVQTERDGAQRAAERDRIASSMCVCRVQCRMRRLDNIIINAAVVIISADGREEEK